VVNITSKANYRSDSFDGYTAKTGQAYIEFDKLFPILLPQVSS